jgi:hypothetical protein
VGPRGGPPLAEVAAAARRTRAHVSPRTATGSRLLAALLRAQERGHAREPPLGRVASARWPRAPHAGTREHAGEPPARPATWRVGIGGPKVGWAVGLVRPRIFPFLQRFWRPATGSGLVQHLRIRFSPCAFLHHLQCRAGHCARANRP